MTSNNTGSSELESTSSAVELNESSGESINQTLAETTNTSNQYTNSTMHSNPCTRAHFLILIFHRNPIQLI